MTTKEDIAQNSKARACSGDFCESACQHDIKGDVRSYPGRRLNPCILQTDKQNGQREVLSLVKGWGKGGSVGEDILDNSAQLLLRNA